MMGDIVSIVAGAVLFVISLLVMKTYWPRRKSTDAAAFYLAGAIFLGFLAHAANTLWWQLIVGISTHLGWVEFYDLRAIGLWLDGVLKGIAAFSGILHLIALQRNLPDDEKPKYHWFDMPWYPRRAIICFITGRRR